MKRLVPIFIILVAVTVFLVGILIQSRRLRSPGSEQNLSVLVLTKLDRDFPGSGPVSETASDLTVKIHNWSVVFSKNKNLDTQIRALQEIVNNLRIDQAKKLVVDLRFNKAVVRSQ